MGGVQLIVIWSRSLCWFLQKRCLLFCCCCFFKYSLPSGLCNLLAIVFAHLSAVIPSVWESTLKRRDSAFPLAGFNLKSEIRRASIKWLRDDFHNVKHISPSNFSASWANLFAAVARCCRHKQWFKCRDLFSQRGASFFLFSFFFKRTFHALCFNVQSAVWIIYCCDGVSSYSCASPFSSIRWISHSGSPTKQWVSFLLIWLLVI